MRAQRIGYDLADALTTERAIAEIAAAFTESDGSPVKAAERLGVSYKQVNRWVTDSAALKAKLDEIRAKKGWPALGGPAGRRARVEPAPPVRARRKTA